MAHERSDLLQRLETLFSQTLAVLGLLITRLAEPPQAGGEETGSFCKGYLPREGPLQRALRTGGSPPGSHF